MYCTVLLQYFYQKEGTTFSTKTSILSNVCTLRLLLARGGRRVLTARSTPGVQCHTVRGGSGVQDRTMRWARRSPCPVGGSPILSPDTASKSPGGTPTQTNLHWTVVPKEGLGPLQGAVLFAETLL